MATIDSSGSPPTPSSHHESEAASTQPQTEKQSTKASTKKTTRADAPNYWADDITALLNFVEEEEPLGSNHWAVVAKKLNAWVAANSRPERDQDSLKNKFDKLANTKKKTGDPSCPAPVRRAKFIARAIHNKCAAMTLGDSSDGDGDGEGNGEATPCSVISDGTSEDNNEEGVVGVRRKKKKTAASGTPTKTKTEQTLLEHVENMTEHIGVISESIKTRSTVSSSVSRTEVVSIVKQELTESMKPTNELLLKVTNMLESMTSNHQE